jgi:hypothetical protein
MKSYAIAEMPRFIAAATIYYAIDANISPFRRFSLPPAILRRC